VRPYLVHHLLTRAATAAPDRPAVLEGERSITYAELDAAANRVANRLLDLGVARGDRVGLHLDKSIDAVAAIYGVLRAGAVYVPLDRQAPPARLARVAADAGLRLVVARAAEPRPPGLGDLRVIDPSAGGPGSCDPPDAPAAIDSDPAYILYTSGSTGSPKGVVLSHRAAMAFVDWAAGAVALTGSDRLSSVAPLHFDLSIFDLFAAAHAAATVVLVPPAALVFPVQLRELVERSGVTVWYSVPSLLTMLTLRGGLEPGQLSAVRAILFAGEVFPIRHLRRLMELVPGARFINLFGPTETNVCTWYELTGPPAEGSALPIGRAIDNVRVVAVTDDGRLAAPGDLGELHVQGATVMSGYWGDAEATARTLRPVPCDPPGSQLAYRTGDLVRELPDGNYLFCGRRDAQIKSRGYRIEPGEVESALEAHPAVVECVAVGVPDDLVTNRVKAVVVVGRAVGRGELARWCSERIPAYMVPDSFEFVPALPRTSTGKIDRRRLVATPPEESR
jgi:amino acid adenylation domain-containing protein